MGKNLHFVTYKPDSQSTDEYIVIVDEAEYKRWKEDKSVALALVVDSFEIYHSNTGHQGKLGRPSKQQLETVFDSSKEDDVVKFILEKGTLKAGDISKDLTGLNASRGGNFVDTRGSGGGLRG